jgi:hypothetical protein
MNQPLKSLSFGIREEAWPKGHGYLYFRRGKAGACERLCDLDLYNTADDVLRELFSRALEDALRRLGCSMEDIAQIPIETENMSSLARNVLFRELESMRKRKT